MDSFEFEYKLQTVLLVIEAAAYLALAVWCVNRGRESRWAVPAGVGAALIGLVLGISAAATFENVFFESTHIYEKVLFHQHLSTVLVTARVLGVLLLAAGFVQSRRTPPAPTGSIYGS